MNCGGVPELLPLTPQNQKKSIGATESAFILQLSIQLSIQQSIQVCLYEKLANMAPSNEGELTSLPLVCFDLACGPEHTR